jgi:hypothetical protein
MRRSRMNAEFAGALAVALDHVAPELQETD